MISIIIPVFNGDKYIKDCIHSILQQSYKNFEIIIVNDCSTDKTSNIIENYKKEDSRIKVFHLNKRVGSAISRNIGIKNAKGNYISFCDADDTYTPNALKNLRTALVKNNCDFSVGNIQMMSHDMSYPVSVSPSLLPLWIEDSKCVIPTQCYHLWIPWFHPRFLFKKIFLNKNNIYYPNLLRGQDPPMLAKAICTAKSAAIIPNTVYKYRSSLYNKISSEKQIKDYLLHIKLTINLFCRFDQNKLASIYLRHITKNFDSIHTVKNYNRNQIKNITRVLLIQYEKECYQYNIMPFFFENYIKDNIKIMNFNILLYVINKIYRKIIKNHE